MELKIKEFMDLVIKRNNHEPEFLQAVQEVAETVIPFIENNPKISKSKRTLSNNNLANERIKENDFATENLAKIYIKQNKISEAIKIYKKLLSNNSKKKSYFAKKIEKLKS